MNVRQARKQVKPKQKVDIMNMISNAYLNKNRFFHKQPKIRPRIGIFGNSMFATVRRSTADDKEDIAINKRIKARLEGNLGALLCQSDSEIRPQKQESFINLPVQLPGPSNEVWQYVQPKPVPIPVQFRPNLGEKRRQQMQQIAPKVPVPEIDLISEFVSPPRNFPQNGPVADFPDDCNTLDMSIRAHPRRIDDAKMTFDFNVTPPYSPLDSLRLKNDDNWFHSESNTPGM